MKKSDLKKEYRKHSRSISEMVQEMGKNAKVTLFFSCDYYVTLTFALIVHIKIITVLPMTYVTVSLSWSEFIIKNIFCFVCRRK